MSSILIKNHRIESYKPIICVPVTGSDKDEVFMQASNLIAAKVDMIEWRIDYLKDYRDPDLLSEILQMLKNICDETILVATIRTQQEGGLADLSEEEIRPLLEVIAKSGCADIIDIEFARYRDPSKYIAELKGLGAIVLTSRHELTTTPDVKVMQDLLQRMTESGSDIVKLATVPNSSADVLNLLQVTNDYASDQSHPPVISMAMGNKGVISRVCGEIFGSSVTFGAIGKGSAPGQVQCDELRDILQFFHNSLL